MLKKFDREDKAWQQVKKRIWGTMGRFRSIEILLRVIAFSNNLDRYNGNLAGFLNSYMGTSTKLESDNIEQMMVKLSFMSACAFEFLSSLSSGKKSLTFMEAALVALFSNVNILSAMDADALHEYLLAKSKSFVVLPSFVNVQRYALSSEQIVKARLREAINLFSSDIA